VTNLWLLGFTPILLAVTAASIIRGGAACRSYWLAWCGLAVTMAGDYFLAVRGAPLASDSFLYGVAGFSLAQTLWIAFLRRHAAWNPRLAAGLLFSFGVLFAARVIPALPSARLAWALGGYGLLSAVSVSYACGRHPLSSAWRFGLCALLFSDTLIAFGQILRVPHVRHLVGVTYLASLLLIAAGIARCGRCPRPGHRLRLLRRAPLAAFWGGLAAFALFLAAMLFYPGKAYNPCMRMLSVLGRTRLDGVDYPVCHYLFTAGLMVSALAAARFYPALACFVTDARAKLCLRWGGALNAAGLLAIAFVPENVNGFYHNVGCFAAVGGGGLALLMLTPARLNPRTSGLARWNWLVWCSALVTVFQTFLCCHQAKVLPFAPYVPTCQKLLILTFAAWLGYYALLLSRLTRRVPCHTETGSGILPT